MGIEAVAGKAAGLLEKYLARFGRVSPWVGAGLIGVAIGGALFKNRRDEKRLRETAAGVFRDEIRERDLWTDVRSQVAGAAEDLYRTFHVYPEGEVRPILHRGHAYEPRPGELVIPADEPDPAEAAELLGRALENLAGSRVNDLPLYRERGIDPSRELTPALKRVKARLDRAAAGRVQKPDFAGMQKALDALLEERVKPVVSDLAYVVDQGTQRIRAALRKGEHRETVSN